MVRLAAAALVATAMAMPAPQAPALAEHQRNDAKRILASLHRAMKQTYYDTAFRGIDIDAHFKAAAKKLDSAQTLPHAYGIIAQALVDFEDSHTYFIPPMRAATVEYGWDMRMIGDACYVTAVKPGSDAHARGLKVGDQLLQIDQVLPTRQDLWKVRYVIYTLSPRSRMRLVARSPGDAEPRVIEVAAKVTPQPKVVNVDIESLVTTIMQETREARAARNQMGRHGEVGIWKLSGFDFDPADVDRVFDSAIKGATSLVIDMRGNGGGFIRTLEQLAGRLFGRDVTLATVKTRKSSRPMTAKKRKTQFDGRIVVLIDSDTGSAAELLARAIQLEKRGIVIGDRSSGAVMQGELFTDAIEGSLGLLFFHASITNADLIMADGRSLERVGVQPDELVVPSPADLAAGRDPVLARAVTLLGGTLDAVTAGAMFPLHWR